MTSRFQSKPLISIITSKFTKHPYLTTPLFVCRAFLEESISESKQTGRDRSYQRPSASNANRLLLPDNDGPPNKNEFLTTFLKPLLINSKTNHTSIITNNNQQRDKAINHLNPHNNNDADDEENNEIQPTREDRFSSIRSFLDSKY